LSFYHKVTSPIVIILKIEVSLDNHREVQFSNPEKGPKSEENDPRYQEAGYGPETHTPNHSNSRKVLEITIGVL